MATQQGELRIRISAKDKASKSLKRLTGSIKNLVVAYLSFRGVKAAIGLIGDMTRAAGVQEKAVAKLNQQLRNWGELTAENTNRLTGLATSLSRVTQFSDEQIIAGQAMLGSFALTADQIGKATSRMLDIAIMTESTTGQMSDLTAVAKMMGMAMDRNAGMLSRAGIVLSDYQRRQLNASTGMEKFNILMEIMDQNAKGLATSVGKTWAGQMAILNNQLIDTKEELGNVIVQSGAWKELIGIINTEIFNLNKWLIDNKETVTKWGLTLATTAIHVAMSLTDTFHGMRVALKDVSVAWLQYRKIGTYLEIEGKTYRKNIDKSIEALNAETQAIFMQRNEWMGWLEDVENKIIAANFKLSESIAGSGGGGGGDDKSIAGALTKLNETLDESDFAVNKWATDLDEIVAGLQTKKLWDELHPPTPDPTEWEVFFTDLKQNAESFSQSWASGVIDNIARGQTTFDQFAKSFISGMTKMIAKALVFKAIKMAFGIPFKGGGLVGRLGLQSGGFLGGNPPYGDRIPAMLDSREFVMSPEATSRIGVGNLERMNQGDTFHNSIDIGGISVVSSGDAKYDASRLAGELENILPEVLLRVEKRKRKGI